jgi:putative transposase
LLDLSTATWRYTRRGRVDNRALLARLQAQTVVRPRWGYRRLHTLVAREDLVANRKRVYRVYREAGLQVPPAQAHARRAGAATAADSRAATLVDRFHGRHAGGRPRLPHLNVVDYFSHECVAIEVDRSLPGARVVRVLVRPR